MASLTVTLFGRFTVHRDGRAIEGLNAHKIQEIFTFLLLKREQPHSREKLAGLFWSDHSNEQSRAYLRRALWQLQNTLDPHFEIAPQHTLIVEPEWVQLNPEASLSLDVSLFEQTNTQYHNVRGQDLDDQQIQRLQSAVELYKGDLLEGWYQDWCLRERERLQSMYLVMLQKLMAACESRHDYECGLDYGSRILCYDRAHERTHRSMMRLAYLLGDRSAALRQFERCRKALEEELGIQPDESTIDLYSQISVSRVMHLEGGAQHPTSQTTLGLHDMLGRLRRLELLFSQVQIQLRDYVQAVEALIHKSQ